MSRRRIAAVAAVVLAVIGAFVLTTAVLDRRTEPPEAAGIPAAPPDAAPPAPTRPGELTRGPQMATSPPTRVSIPKLRVAVPVVGLGLAADGSMAVPSDAATVGWFTGAPTPGSLGPAVLAGHVDFLGKAGTFARLSDLRKGDAVTVQRSDGSTATFAVTATERYAKNRFPSAAVYGPIDHAGLRLITCGGEFDRSAGHYRDNVVVYATLRTAG